MIFLYDNPQDWLRAELERRQKLNPKFSLSAFAKKLGLSQPLVSLLLSGQRRLTLQSSRLITKKLALSESEREYLESMALGSQHSAKGTSLRQEIRQRHEVSTLSLDSFEAMSDWYYSAILELLLIKDLAHDSAIFAKRLGLEKNVVEHALKTLIRLDLIAKSGERYVRTDSGFTSTSHDVSSSALRNFHKQIFVKAAAALDDQSPQKRQVSGYTLAINPAKLPQAKKLIQEFSSKLGRLLEEGEQQEVYQLSISLFSLEDTK